MMKKFLSVLLATVMMSTCLVGFAGCGKDEKYDLVYLSWNLSTEAVNNIERQMIKEFEKKEGVKIKIEENVVHGSGYGDAINALAVKNALPDVFMTQNINFGLQYQYAADIKSLVEADNELTGDWNKLPQSMRDAATYKSGIYAIPFSLHLAGYFANVDLIAEKNKDAYLNTFSNGFGNDYTQSTFYKLVSEMATLKSEGIIGLNSEDTVIEWYPAATNDELGWFTWDGEKYNLDSDEFGQAIEITNALNTQQLTYASLPDTVKEQYFEGVTDAVDLWNKKKLALRWGSTAELQNIMQNATFDVKFMSIPGDRPAIISDFVMISNTCQNKELAYKFSKWMSFDPAGIRKRIELEKAAGSEATNTLPMINDEEIINEYFEYFDDVDGLKEVYQNLNNGFQEAVKIVPGYGASRWEKVIKNLNVSDGETTIKDIKIGELVTWCWLGKANYADYKTQMNKAANDAYASAVSDYADLYA